MLSEIMLYKVGSGSTNFCGDYSYLKKKGYVSGPFTVINNAAWIWIQHLSQYRYHSRYVISGGTKQVGKLQYQCQFLSPDSARH